MEYGRGVRLLLRRIARRIGARKNLMDWESLSSVVWKYGTVAVWEVKL